VRCAARLLQVEDAVNASEWIRDAERAVRHGFRRWVRWFMPGPTQKRQRRRPWDEPSREVAAASWRGGLLRAGWRRVGGAKADRRGARALGRTS